MALRVSDNLPRAKEILDAAIKRYPDDEGLRLQRAFLAYAENDPADALTVLPNKPLDPEAIGVRAHALMATGKPDEALSLIDGIDEDQLAKHVKIGFLAVRTRAYIARGEKQLAVNTIAQQVAVQPHRLRLRALQIRILRIAGDEGGARQALKEAVASVNDQSSLQSRLELSFEARILSCDDVIVDLLKDRIALDRESEGLHALIAA